MEILDQISRMPKFLERAIEAAGPGGLWRRAAGDFFSLGEQACHLRDLEREGWLVRVRRILEEDTPDLAGFDGDAVARARNYPSQDAHSAMRDFAAARGELVAIVSTATREQLARGATIFGKRITLAELLPMIEAHDHGHREEIEALVAVAEPR